MGHKDNPYHIEKLKGEKNWETYYVDLKAVLVKEKYWKYASGRIKLRPKPVFLEGSIVDETSSAEASRRKKHEKELETWQQEKDEFDEGHEEAMSVIHLTTMPEPREHIKGHTNAEEAIAKLLKQYGTSNMATVDLAFQEICRSNMDDFPGLFEYAEHIQRNYNKILQAGRELYPWQLSSAFRMGLPSTLSPYVFPLVNSAKNEGRDLTIDDMVDALAEEQKRSNYNEEKTEAARIMKKNNKTKDSRNNKSNGTRERGKGPCSVKGCSSPYHDAEHCPYENPDQRGPNWLPFELKLNIAKDWKKEDGYVPANKAQKARNDRQDDRSSKPTAKKARSYSKSSSSSDSSASSAHPSRSRIVKIRQRNDQFQTNSVRRINSVATKDSKFYLDTAADSHCSHNRSLFNDDFRPLRSPKSIEVAIGHLTPVEGVGSITFTIMVNGRKERRTIKNVEYVPGSEYNLIATGLLSRKVCKCEHDDKTYIVKDADTNEIFITGTIQSAGGNSYTLDHITSGPKVRLSKKQNTWTMWHRRLGHLNMRDVKKLAKMGLIDAAECNKNQPTEEVSCESCAMGKMHRSANHSPVRAERRATRKGQRIHTDLAGGGNIVRTPKGKRYVIVLIDDFTDFTWIYLVRHKSEFKRVLKEFILMLKAQGHNIESIRCDNARENINDETSAMVKEHGIQWEPTVPDNPHQNGVPERSFRTIFNRLRACLYEAKLPKKLWGEACHFIVYLKNRSPCKLLQDVTPYEAWTNRKPDISHLHPFGTYCVANKERAKKLDDQGIKCRLLGYGASNQYVLWDLERHCVIRAVHVLFDEAVKTPEIREDEANSEEYAYATLDFEHSNSYRRKSLGDSQHGAINGSTEDRHDDSKGPEENQQTESFDTDSENDTEDNSETPSANQNAGISAVPSDSATASASTPSQPLSTTTATSPSSGRELRRRPENRQSYARTHDPWNKRLGGQGTNDPGNARKARGFAAKIRKAKSTAYQIPNTFAEALAHPDKDKFMEAMRVEVNHHKAKGTWKLMIPDPNTKVIDGRWVYAVKEDAEGNIVRWKARWVARGYLQRYGVDYFETYSGVVKTMIWQLILALVTKYDYEAHHVDIVTAFLESDL